jgi:hypothetical protein
LLGVVSFPAWIRPDALSDQRREGFAGFFAIDDILASELGDVEPDLDLSLDLR